MLTTILVLKEKLWYLSIWGKESLQKFSICFATIIDKKEKEVKFISSKHIKIRIKYIEFRFLKNSFANEIEEIPFFAKT